MKIQVTKDEVSQLMEQAFWRKSGVKLQESSETVDTAEATPEAGDETEAVQESQVHTCPLCESQLEHEISDEKLAEHVDFVLGIINEMDNVSDEELDELAEELISDEELEDAKSKKK